MENRVISKLHTPPQAEKSCSAGFSLSAEEIFSEQIPHGFPLSHFHI